MLNIIRLFSSTYIIVSLIMTVNPLAAQEAHANGSTKYVSGSLTNGLLSSLEINPASDGWQIDILLTAQTNFPAHAWLKITNRVSSKLELWLTNGVQVLSTNFDVLDVFNLPTQTTVSNIMRHSFFPRSGRAYQWWLVGRPASKGAFNDLANFNLSPSFEISSTNDYVLQITPLIYKVETNEETAHLVEFPPIKVKLLSNGEVQKLQ